MNDLFGINFQVTYFHTIVTILHDLHVLLQAPHLRHLSIAKLDENPRKDIYNTLTCTYFYLFIPKLFHMKVEAQM